MSVVSFKLGSGELGYQNASFNILDYRPYPNSISALL